MPGEAMQCRERARDCIEMAREAGTSAQKQLLTDLAQSWLTLAIEIERHQDLLGDFGQHDAIGPQDAGAPQP